MKDDLISREALINAKPEFMNEKVVRDTKYRTTKDRIYAKAWNACNSYWLDTIIDAPTVPNEYMRGYEVAEREYKRPTGEWILIDDVTDPLDHLNRHRCSECGRIIRVYDGQTLSDYSFCHCGADMRGGRE